MQGHHPYKGMVSCFYYQLDIIGRDDFCSDVEESNAISLKQKPKRPDDRLGFICR